MARTRNRIAPETEDNGVVATMEIPPATRRGKKAGPSETSVVIAPPNFAIAEFEIKGTAPLVIHRFSVKAQRQIMETQAAGSQAKSKKKREAKDFNALYEEGFYRSAKEGWYGIPAACFRAAMIGACRLVNFKMTHARQAIFILAEDVDKDDGQPLVRLYGTPEQHTGPVRNATGVIDIRVRPMFREWHAKLRIKFDRDQFSLADVVNLLARSGVQCGICEGRPNSRMSNGCGWGTYEICS